MGRSGGGRLYREFMERESGRAGEREKKRLEAVHMI